MRRLFNLLPFLLLFFLVESANAQTQPILIAPNVFLRGIQLPDGVRYTASVVKPSDDTVMRNVSVEITLPADAILMEMLISRQIEFDVVRQNQAGQLTLIWQISRVPGEAPLAPFSFMLAQPLSGEVEFYTVWQSEDGLQRVENFHEVPPITIATQNEAQLMTVDAGFSPVGNTGVQIAVSTPGILLTGRVLPVDFNPPVEYSNLWWCSLLEIVGLPAGLSADVIVPLRRPLSPFTPVQLYRHQSDGSWLLLDQQGIVTADGQYALYTHPGGTVATGVPAEFQSEILPATEIVIEQVIDAAIQPPEPAPTSAPGDIADGSSNTILLGEGVPPTNVPPPPTTAGQITDGSSNTVFIGEGVPPTEVSPRPTNAPNEITDGSSNTIIIGEGVPPTGEELPPTDVVTLSITPEWTVEYSEDVRAVYSPTPTNAAESPVTLPTLIIINPTTTSVGQPSPTSRTIVISESTPTTVSGVDQIADGSSNTILLGETTPAQAPPATSAPGDIADGSSNTIFIGEATPTPQFFTATATSGNLPQPPASPFPAPVIPNPFGQGGGRLEIIVGNSGTIMQCQFGRVNCATLRRRLGVGLR